MNIYVSDKEQAEMIRKWWRENGKFIIFSVIITVALSYGWNHWKELKNQRTAAASTLYEQMLTNADSQSDESEKDAMNLLSTYPKTPYASLAAFFLAKNAISQNKLDIAMQKIDWILKHTNNKDFKQIAKIRKARILLSLKKYNESLALLSVVESNAYLPLINEIKGDIYLAKGENNQAAAAYQNALNMIKKDAPNRSLLEMKFNQIQR